MSQTAGCRKHYWEFFFFFHQDPQCLLFQHVPASQYKQEQYISNKSLSYTTLSIFCILPCLVFSPQWLSLHHVFIYYVYIIVKIVFFSSEAPTFHLRINTVHPYLLDFKRMYRRNDAGNKTKLSAIITFS